MLTFDYSEKHICRILRKMSDEELCLEYLVCQLCFDALDSYPLPTFSYLVCEFLDFYEQYIFIEMAERFLFNKLEVHSPNYETLTRG